MSSDEGSVWWAELSFGAVCLATAAGFVMASTAIGPFADYTLVYGRVLGVAYLALVVGLGVQFLRSGLQKLPDPIRSDTGSDGGSRDDALVAGNDGDADLR